MPLPVGSPDPSVSPMHLPLPNTRPPRSVTRLLAPALIALLTVACGTGSAPGEDIVTSPVDGAPVAERPATGTGGDAEPTLGSAFEPVPVATPDTGMPSASEPPDTETVDTGESAGDATGVPVTGGEGDAAGPATTIDLVDPVAAGPLACTAPTAAMQARALELINAVRAEGRDCGSEGVFAATGPLGWDSRLEAAARTHSADMAATGNFDHTGTDGSSAGDRIERAGYVWGEYAENIAAGQQTLEAAVEGWLASSGHCRNLLAPGVRDTALVCVSNDDARYRRYWTQVFARPFDVRRRR